MAIQPHRLDRVLGGEIVKMRSIGASAVVTMGLLAMSALPAQAAYPVSGFPALKTTWDGAAFGANLSVTWYGRNVGVTGTVANSVADDGLMATLCVTASGGADTQTECRSADNRSRGFNFVIDAPGTRGSYMTVEARLWVETTAGSMVAEGPSAVRYRPA
ncbi:hypothetical protein AB0F81_26415 [Actinoplanes sp. NPDC024001]|uniref:hypothetical protein n=1 Tax=Actinoplanes sp. NPDC024001 TaxID=3154598 RepID=UPI0033E66ECA